MHARNYRPVKGQAYTRKKYAKGFPPPKIVKFTMGDTKATFDIEGRLIALKRAQIRHSALEAARVATNRVLMDKLINDYYMVVHPYPHMILRENKMMAFAGADRLQEGMRKAFGKPIGSAARVKPGQVIITSDVPSTALDLVKVSMRVGYSKIPLPCRVEIAKIEKTIAS